MALGRDASTAIRPSDDSAAFEIETGNGSDASILCLTADRTSNGPHLLYPNPLNPGDRLEVAALPSLSSVNIAARAGRKYTLQRATDLTISNH